MRAANAGTLAAETSVRAVRVTAIVLSVFGTGVLVRDFQRSVVVFPGAAVFAAALELPLLLVGYTLIRLLRPIRAPSRWWSAAAVIWGATTATGCALLANRGLTALWAKGAGTGFASDWSAALSAPLNEEILKLCGVIMIALAVSQAIRGPIDGMVYGALTGLGFQVTENVMYGLNNIFQTGATDPEQAVASSAALRVGMTELGSHWAMTAVAGTGIGFLAARGLRRGTAPALACAATAMAMHLLFDAPRAPTVAKVAINFAIVAVLYLMLWRGYRERARTVISARAGWGDITDAEAGVLLSRYRRRRELRSAQPGTERDQLAARQQAVLDSVEAAAA
jgi:RsiW-degrading membrane proteinase PrsW (M82 family)